MKKNIIFFSFAIFGTLPLLLYFGIFHGALSKNHTSWGEFGSYLSGVYGSIGLIILAYSIYVTKKQFQTQSENEVFYGLLQTLQNLIINTSFFEKGLEYKSYSSLSFLTKVFLWKINDESVHLGRQLLTRMPEKIGFVQYTKLFDANSIAHSNMESIYKEFLEIMKERDSNERWEYVKTYANSVGSETPRQREALHAIGSVYFYKIAFKERCDIYRVVYQRTKNEYGSLLDAYFKKLEFISRYIQRSRNKDLYAEYLSEQFTKYEKVIIFYYLVSGEADVLFASFIRENKVLSDLHLSNELLIDAPSPNEVEGEIVELFSLYQLT